MLASRIPKWRVSYQNLNCTRKITQRIEKHNHEHYPIDVLRNGRKRRPQAYTKKHRKARRTRIQIGIYICISIHKNFILFCVKLFSDKSLYYAILCENLNLFSYSEHLIILDWRTEYRINKHEIFLFIVDKKMPFLRTIKSDSKIK